MDSSELAKKKQKLILGCLIIVVILIISFIVYHMEDDSRYNTKYKNKEVRITTSGQRIDQQALWRNKIEDEQQLLKEQLKEIASLLKLKQQENIQNEEQIAQLQQTVTRLQQQPVINQDSHLNFGSSQEQVVIEDPSIKKIKLALKTSEQKKLNTKTVIDTIPAGAFVSAVLLSGVDASTAMQSSSNPTPMLLRLIDTGTLPRHFQSDLQDCHCTASCYGDISSERVHVRLEKLTCVERATGEIIETSVAGYIAGSDGREGIRGVVVSKDAQFLSRSLIGGIFSGLAQVASPQNRQNIINPFSAGNPTINAPGTGELFQSGMLDGTGNALDRLSQYYISRAEQLQPIVQVAAGQKVDIVFTESAKIGNTSVKQAIVEEREQARMHAKNQKMERHYVH